MSQWQLHTDIDEQPNSYTNNSPTFTRVLKVKLQLVTIDRLVVPVKLISDEISASKWNVEKHLGHLLYRSLVICWKRVETKTEEFYLVCF